MHGCMTECVVCNHPRADGRIAVEAMLDNFTSQDHSVGYVSVSYLEFLTEHDVEL